jgi:uroporphyrinogen-III synthase
MATRAMADTPLAGLAVAVTRPARQNDALVQQLRAAGADVEPLPLLAIEPLQETEQRRKIDARLRQLPDCRMAIFISQNAAEQLLQALADHQLSWPPTIQTFAIGSATAAFLAGHGIVAASPQQMDSEGLLAMPALQDIAGQRCLIFRGTSGRETLAQTLRKRGAIVDYCELYSRQLPEAAARLWADWINGLQNRPALVCINSVETLRNLQAIDPCATSRDNLALLVPGERVARAASAAGFQQVYTASDATDAAMLHTAILRAAMLSPANQQHAASTGTRHD